MRQNLKFRHDVLMRENAAILFDKGHGFRSVATALSLPPGTVKSWCYMYASVGREGLVSMGSSRSVYTFEQKLAVARAIVDEGVPVVDAMSAQHVASRSAAQSWCRAYRKGGEDALRPKRRGRAPGSRSKPKELTREQELEARVRKLEAENAYLKKLAALRAEESLRTGRRQRR